MFETRLADNQELIGGHRTRLGHFGGIIVTTVSSSNRGSELIVEETPPAVIETLAGPAYSPIKMRMINASSGDSLEGLDRG